MTRRQNGKADRAARRAAWDAKVRAHLWARYGVEPLGPDIPAILDAAFRSRKSPEVVVGQLGQRFALTEVESWKDR